MTAVMDAAGDLCVTAQTCRGRYCDSPDLQREILSNQIPDFAGTRLKYKDVKKEQV